MLGKDSYQPTHLTGPKVFFGFQERLFGETYKKPTSVTKSPFPQLF